jgi:hypothetical protein
VDDDGHAQLVRCLEDATQLLDVRRIVEVDVGIPEMILSP